MIENRAISEVQKEEIINKLLIIWKGNPDLRFLQLLGNVFRQDPYYIEDYDMIKIIEKFYNKNIL